MDDHIAKIIDQCIAACGVDVVQKSLVALLDEHQEHVLTIVVNAGQHPLRSVHSRGEVYFASEGLFDYSDQDDVVKQFTKVLQGVSTKLRSKPWKKIYIVPFGPSVLSMQIKLLVYRVLHMETVDVLHIGGDEYLDIKLDQRHVVVE
jgi:hypothetical protein